MPKTVRLHDATVGVCCCHAGCIPMTGIIITASSDNHVNGRGKARLTDVVLGACGHTGVIATASTDCHANGLGVARVGDTTTGCLITTIVTGSDNVHTN